MPQTYEYGDGAQNVFRSSQDQVRAQAQPGQEHAQPQPGQAQPSLGSAQTWQPAPASAAQQPHSAPQSQQPATAPPPPQRPPAAPQQPAPQVVYAQAPQKKGHGWIVAIVVILCLFAFSAFCVKSCTDLFGTGAYSAAAGGPADDSVAIIEMDGTIQYDGSACSPKGLKSLLDQAAGDDRVKAVVLRVNSGGGTATAGEEMAEYVRGFGKPVVVSSASINASAAYEISSQADYIYVAKSTEIGAIGTAMQLTDLSGLLDMLGIDVEVITSADSKDSSYGYRPLTEEERAYYQRMIDQINDTFVENVAQGRSMDVEAVRALATGLAFTGLDAVDNGLADEVGTLEDAVEKAAELAGVTDYSTYDLALSTYNLSALYGLLGSGEADGQTAFPVLGK